MTVGLGAKTERLSAPAGRAVVENGRWCATYTSAHASTENIEGNPSGITESTGKESFPGCDFCMGHPFAGRHGKISLPFLTSRYLK